jgi:hypothetical protein
MVPSQVFSNYFMNESDQDQDRSIDQAIYAELEYNFLVCQKGKMKIFSHLFEHSAIHDFGSICSCSFHEFPIAYPNI